MHYNNFNSQKVLIKERYSSITQKIMTNLKRGEKSECLYRASKVSGFYN